MKAYNQLTQSDKLILYHFIQASKVVIHNEIESKYRNYYMYSMLESILDEPDHRKLQAFIDTNENQINIDLKFNLSIN